MSKEARILVMYGYHPTEKFAIDVGRSLTPLESDYFLVRKYTGQLDNPCRGDGFTVVRYPMLPNWHAFVGEHLPLKYVIDLHNGRRDVAWETDFKRRNQNVRLPAVLVAHGSRHRISRRTLREVQDLCLHQPYLALASFIPSCKYAMSEYDKIEVELFPHLISKQQSTDLLRGLAEILVSRSR